MPNYIYASTTGDGQRNLAADVFFLQNIKKGDIVLYFYVNDRAVIIGRNQNAWKECRLDKMREDGVQLVRRHTGGGAVYHDGGNLNFSFIMHERDYDLDRQMRVITNAVRKLGLEPELSGRNDVLIGGRKFSGNAYALTGSSRAHHGTLLVSTDLEKLQDYLHVSKAKMNAKGVDSVRARVIDLAELVPGLTVERLRELVIECFVEEYGPAEDFVFDRNAEKKIDALREKQASWDWLFGKTPPFDYILDHRFSFGETQLHFSQRDGAVKAVKVYSDSLDIALAEEFECLLTGKHFAPDALAAALMPEGCDKHEKERAELAAYLLKTIPGGESSTL